jgi:hypothetical protein
MKRLIRYIILVIMFFSFSCNEEISFKEIELDVTNLTKTTIAANGVSAYEISANVVMVNSLERETKKQGQFE